MVRRARLGSMLASSTSREGENTPRLNGCSNEWHSFTRIGASQQAAAYRPELEAVRKLEKSAPASASDVVDFPKGTFTLKGPYGVGLGAQTRRPDQVHLKPERQIRRRRDITSSPRMRSNSPMRKARWPRWGPAKPEHYKWKLDNGNLTFTWVTDEGARAAILTSGPWEKKE